MTANHPVLVSIKSNWEPIAERPTVGKDVLELLSSSMYVNPLSIYREYVQNAADSLEEAKALGLINHQEPGRVDITVDGESRVVRIRDNGTGIARAAFIKTLVALGASRKRGTKARGFRGVGRLAGLGYCRELIFRTQAAGEHEISEMRWDCQRLKASLRDVAFQGDLEELVKEVVRVHRTAANDAEAHFFEVELREIVRHGDDRLMSSEIIANYLMQVAPVPFAPNFKFGAQIEERLGREISLASIQIYMNGSTAPLFRPHRDQFEVRRGAIDEFTGVRFFDIDTGDGKLAAVGWVLDHSYLGAIDAAASMKGLRVRSGNMQVGESDVLQDLFTEARFNAWVVGEVHVLDDRILPNGRRDHFEQNVHLANLRNQLRPIAIELSRRCRQSSIHRNVLRQFEAVSGQVLHNLGVLRQGAVSSGERAKIRKEIERDLIRAEKTTRHSALEEIERKRLVHSVNRYRRQFERGNRSEQHRILSAMAPRDRTLVGRVFSLIYECSPNKSAAKTLIDRVLARMR